MNAPVAFASPSRRQLLQGAGALVVTAVVAPEAAFAAAGKPALHPTELDSWVAVAPDGMITAYFGKPDVGQGVDVAIAQIVAEELDVPVSRVSVVLGDTALTCDQGGVSGSTGVQRGGVALRNAAAEARRLLVERAAERLGVAADQLTVDDGVVSAGARKVGYGELVQGGYFHTKLDWNGQLGNGLVASGKAKPKPVSEYKVIGASPPRRDVEGKVFGTYAYAADQRPEGMLHGRVIRPPVAGSKPLAVDEASIAGFKGVRVLRKGDFIGVVAEKEWDAVRAARALKVTWSDAPMPFFPSEALYDHIRKAEPQKREVTRSVGSVEEAFKAGGTIVEAEYEWPFQSHASLGPGAAVADIGPDGGTIWTPSQKPHATTLGCARMLGFPPEKIRSIFVQGPGSYGRNDAGDACADAAVMSMLAGRPVKAQGMRHEGHGWDPKGTASIHKVRAAIGPDGKLVAYDFLSKGFTRMEVATAEAAPHDLLAGMLLGFEGDSPPSFGAPEDGYVVANRRVAWEVIPSLLPGASPLRTSHFRDPLGPQIHFASECFIDECALAAGADPVAFRLAHIENPRHRAVIEAAARAADWKPGPPGARRRRSGGVSIGRGFSYANRGDTVVAVAAEVEIDRATGRIWPRRFWLAHDCGLIINPAGLKLCIEGNVVHGASRALFEEVTFDEKNVTSVDWARYPILEIGDAPESVEIVLINRPDLPPGGAGEPSTRPIAAAIANAVYDAVGARLRRAPFTPARVKASMDA